MTTTDRVKAWLVIQAKLFGCSFRLIAAIATANEAAFAHVNADIDALHKEWHA